MRQIYRSLVLLSGLIFVTGCGSSGGVGPEVQSSAPAPSAKWSEHLLTQSREDLAKKGDEIAEQIRLREQGRKKGKVKYDLLPKFAQPVVLPVFQDAKYRKEAGYSLPAYADTLTPDQRRELAVLLARFGDGEAATKLLQGQPELRLDKLRGGKNYQLEWTRVVALQLHQLQQRLAMGEADALAELIDLREQLDSSLDAAAKAGWLGQSLFPRGRTTLKAAAAAWRERKKTELADKADAALAKWPEPTEFPTAAVLGEPRAYWTQTLQAKGEGRAFVATPAAFAMDLLQLPLPQDGADALVFFFDPRHQAEALWLFYGPRVRDEFDNAADLAAAFAPWATPATQAKKSECRQQWKNVTLDTTIGPGGSAPGAWMRIALREPTATPLPRSFGAAHLDRSFELNRLTFTPQSLESPILIKDRESVAKFENPLGVGKVLEIGARQVAGHDLLEEVRIAYGPGNTFGQLALPLLERFGPGALSCETSGTSGLERARLVWEDAHTQLTLDMNSNADYLAELSLRDRRDTGKAGERLQAVAALEKAERDARLEAKKPQQRVPRKVEAFALGMDKADVQRFLPQGQAVFKREVGDGLIATINTVPPQTATHTVRQVIVRFNAERRVRFAQVRYESVSKKKDVDWVQQLLASWRRAGGLIASGPAPLLPRVSDLPAQSPRPIAYRWKDDITVSTIVIDRSGVEITVEDRPPTEQANAPFAFLPRGPQGAADGVLLGVTRSELAAKLTTTPPTSPDGAWLLRPTSGAFDAVLVWFENERISQISGRYSLGATAKSSEKDLEAALLAQWARDIQLVGWPDRRDYSRNGVLQSLSWFDDAGRYRIYWADADNSPPRLWSEWRDK